MHDYDNLRYITEEGRIIDLTYLENEILDILIENKGHYVRNQTLCKLLYIDNELSIRALIFRLRQKLMFEIEIKNKKSMGYKIN